MTMEAAKPGDSGPTEQTNKDKTIRYSKVENVGDTNPTLIEQSWHQITTDIAKPEIRGHLPYEDYHKAEKDIQTKQKWGPAIIPSIFNGSGRKEEHVTEVNMLVADIDTGNLSLEYITKKLEGFKAAFHTTYSSQPDEKRWRVIVPFAHPVRENIKEQYAAIHKYFDKLFEGHLDNSGKNPAHIFFIPSCPKGGEKVFRHGSTSGTFFDPETVRANAEAKSPPPPNANCVAQCIAGDPEKLIEPLSDDLKAKIRVRPTEDADRSKDLYNVICGLLEAGVENKADIKQIITYPQFGISDKPLEKGTEWTDQEIERSIKRWTEKTNTKEKKNVEPFEWLSRKQIHEKSSRVIDWLIEDTLEKGSVVNLFGDPSSGKSLILMEMAYCVATGTHFHDRKVKQCKVFYVMGEGTNGLNRRLLAIEHKYGKTFQQDNWFFSKNSASLCDRENAEAVGKSLENEKDAQLIIIDTLHRNFGSGDENSSADLAKFFDNIEKYIRRDDSTIIIAHHTGHHDKTRARGSSAIRASIDVEFKTEKTGNKVTLCNSKNRDFDLINNMVFTVKTADLGDGVTAPYLDPQFLFLSDLQPQQLKCLDCLKAVIEKSDSKSASMEDWRKETKKTTGWSNKSNDTSKFNKRFAQIKSELIRKDYVVLENGSYFISEVISINKR